MAISPTLEESTEKVHDNADALEKIINDAEGAADVALPLGGTQKNVATTLKEIADLNAHVKLDATAQSFAGDKTATGHLRTTGKITAVDQDEVDKDSLINIRQLDKRFFLPEQINHIPAIAIEPDVTLISAIDLSVIGDRLKWSTTNAAEGGKFTISDSFGTTEGAGQSTRLSGRCLEYYFTTARSPASSIVRVGFGVPLSVVLGDLIVADFGIQFQIKQDAGGEFTRIIAADGTNPIVDTTFVLDNNLFVTGEFEHFKFLTDKTNAEIWRKTNNGEWELFNTLVIPATLSGSYGSLNRYLLYEQERLVTGSKLFNDVINQKIATY